MGVWVGGPGPHRPLRDRPQRPGAHTAQLVNRGGLVGRAPPRGLPGTAPGAAVQGSPADGPEGSAVRTAQRVFPNPSPTVRRGRPGRPGVGSGAGMLSAFAGAPLALLTWQAQGPPLVTGRYMPVRSGSMPGTASSRCPASPVRRQRDLDLHAAVSLWLNAGGTGHVLNHPSTARLRNQSAAAGHHRAGRPGAPRYPAV